MNKIVMLFFPLFLVVPTNSSLRETPLSPRESTELKRLFHQQNKNCLKKIKAFFSARNNEINRIDEEGESVLFYACSSKNPKTIKVVTWLLDAGANIYLINNEGEFVIHQCEQPNIVELLVEKDSSLLNTKDSNGFTLLGKQKFILFCYRQPSNFESNNIQKQVNKLRLFISYLENKTHSLEYN